MKKKLKKKTIYRLDGKIDKQGNYPYTIFWIDDRGYRRAQCFRAKIRDEYEEVNKHWISEEIWEKLGGGKERSWFDQGL